MSRRIVELSRDMKDDYNYNESIKTLRTNILFCGSKVRTIMFTSSVPDEGKSDITFAAAQSMAQLGKKVLVIDADIPPFRTGKPVSAWGKSQWPVPVSQRTEAAGGGCLRYQRRKPECDFCRSLFSQSGRASGGEAVYQTSGVRKK